jgi:hypothetical protein
MSDAEVAIASAFLVEPKPAFRWRSNNIPYRRTHCTEFLRASPSLGKPRMGRVVFRPSSQFLSSYEREGQRADLLPKVPASRLRSRAHIAPRELGNAGFEWDGGGGPLH